MLHAAGSAQVPAWSLNCGAHPENLPPGRAPPISSKAPKGSAAAAEGSEVGPLSLGTKARGMLGALRPAYWQVRTAV